MMNYYSAQIVFQEVPNEISLAFSITGCPLQCSGCHSSFAWRKNLGSPLTLKKYQSLVDQYQNLISCVCFLGGEWHEKQLLIYLKYAKSLGLKTCLYTGLEDVSISLKKELDFLKVGVWNKELGGLDSPNTNQKFINLKSGTIENHYFRRSL